MADGRQPEEHWASNGQENGENGYSAYSSAYRENGYHGGAAAHPGTTGRNMDMVCWRSRAFMHMQYWLNDIDWPASQPDGSAAVGKWDWFHGARKGRSIPKRHLNRSNCFKFE